MVLFPVTRTGERQMPKIAVPVSARVQQSRDRRRNAGMKRIEVFVPEGNEDMVKAGRPYRYG